MNTLILRDDRKLVQTFSSTDCNEYDVIDMNTNVRIAYVVEYFKSPIDNEVLQVAVKEQLREAYQLSEDDLEYVKEEFSAFCKNQQLKNR